jgi:hypothetical protein
LGTLQFEIKAPHKRGASPFRRTELVQARESSDNPRLNAFWRVAPSVRLKTLASFRADVFFRAADFSSRTSEAVHERRFDFLVIKESPGWGRNRLLADSNGEENRNLDWEGNGG